MTTYTCQNTLDPRLGRMVLGPPAYPDHTFSIDDTRPYYQQQEAVVSGMGTTALVESIVSGNPGAESSGLKRYIGQRAIYRRRHLPSLFSV